jgi:hypothetical protein
MDHRIQVSFWSGALVLAVGLAMSAITSTVVASRALNEHARQQARSRHEITVKGSTRMRVKSDTAVWNITVTSREKELKAAYAMIESGVARVDAFLKARGFTAETISLGAIQTDSFHQKNEKGNDTTEIGGYDLSRTFTLTTASVEKVANAAGDVTELIKDGVLVSSGRPRYYFAKAADIKVQILGEASKDAKARAEEIVKNAGGTLGQVRDAQMGVLQITPPNSTEVSGSGIYDTSTIEKDVSAVVTVTFGVE